MHNLIDTLHRPEHDVEAPVEAVSSVVGSKTLVFLVGPKAEPSADSTGAQVRDVVRRLTADH